MIMTIIRVGGYQSGRCARAGPVSVEYSKREVKIAIRKMWSPSYLENQYQEYNCSPNQTQTSFRKGLILKKKEHHY